MGKKWDFEQLKAVAIKLYAPIKAFNPEYNIYTTVSPIEVTYKNQYSFNYNNGVTVFLDDSHMYVIPSSPIVFNIIDWFKPNCALFVPFSNGEYPVNEKAKWEEARKLLREQEKIELAIDIAEYCDIHNIGEIPDELLSKCFEIPENGLKVIDPYNFEYPEYYIFPTINTTFLDRGTAEKLGKYTINNGTLAFVYRDGRTFVTRNQDVFETLCSAGYKEGGFFVPFSNGEKPLDPFLAEKWRQIANG